MTALGSQLLSLPRRPSVLTVGRASVRGCLVSWLCWSCFLPWVLCFFFSLFLDTASAGGPGPGPALPDLSAK